jgi:cell division protein FtsB
VAQPRDAQGVGGSSPKPQATGRWLRGLRFSGFSIFMMALLILAVVVLAPSLREYVQQRDQIVDAQQVVNDLKSQVTELNAERDRWSDPSYIRAEARARLYYVMPGETSYLVIDDRPPAAKRVDEGPVSTKIQSTPSDWVGSLFGSFMTAGLSTATPAELSGNGSAAGTGAAPTATTVPSPSTTPTPATSATPKQGG